MRDGFPRAPSGSPGRIGVAVSVGDGEQGFSASDMGSRFSLRATDAHKPESRSWSVSFRRGSFWRRLIGKPPGEVEELAAYSTFAGIATPMATDPLVLGSGLLLGSSLLVDTPAAAAQTTLTSGPCGEQGTLNSQVA